jgi:hypothetical protein
MDGADEKIHDSDRNLDEINSKIDKLLDKSDSLTRYVQNLDGRLAEVEENQSVSGRPKFQFATSKEHEDNAQGRNAKIREPFEQFSRDVLDHSPEVEQSFTSVDSQEDFQSIKDSVQKIKLPADLKISESKQGIRREDQQTLAVISRNARYAETTLKLLSTFDDGTSNESVDNKLSQIVKIQQAQIYYFSRRVRQPYCSVKI